MLKRPNTNVYNSLICTPMSFKFDHKVLYYLSYKVVQLKLL